VIGETPQPGEKPSTEGNPWSFSDPGPGWWRGETDRAATDPPTGHGRHPRRRAPQHQAEAAQGGTGTLLPPGEAGPKRSGRQAEAHAAGVRDTERHLDPAAEPPIVERSHDQPDTHRYDPLRPPAGHRPRRTAATVAADEHAPAPKAPTAAAEATLAAMAQAGAEPVEEVAAGWAVQPTDEHKIVEAGEPDVMVLPEPSARNRPTVPLEPPPPAAVPTVPAVPAVPAVRQNRRVQPTEPLPPVADRKFLDIDVDNFDSRMKALKPRVAFQVPNTLTGEGNMSVELTFESMDDFSPAAVASKVDALNKLLEARKQLSNLITYMDGKTGAEDLVAKLLQDPALLQSLASTKNPQGENS